MNFYPTPGHSFCQILRRWASRANLRTRLRSANCSSERGPLQSHSLLTIELFGHLQSMHRPPPDVPRS